MKGPSQKLLERRQAMNTENQKSTVLSDEKIVDMYLKRDENAIFHSDLKYGKYLFTVAYNVLHDKSDCEECVNDTYLGAWKAMPPHACCKRRHSDRWRYGRGRPA